MIFISVFGHYVLKDLHNMPVALGGSGDYHLVF